MELYVLKSAACWALLYGFYKLLLERESMHQLKRWYLLGGLVLGALIPLVTFTTYITADAGSVSYIIRTEEVSTVTNPSFWESIDYIAILWSVYWLGFAVFAGRFVWNLGKLLRRIWSHPKQSQRPLFYVLLARPVQPHTFFKYIFVNSKRFAQRAIPKEVLLHEQAHAQQLHSADVLLAEALQVVFWFNPLVYLLKHSILLNHEFLADEAVLNTGVPKSQYQNTLLAYLNPRTCPDLASAINYSSIKKRFTLMKNSSSKKSQWAKSLLLLPLLAVLLYSFSTTREVLLEEEIPYQQENVNTQSTDKGQTNIYTLEQIKATGNANVYSSSSEEYLAVKHPTLQDFKRWQDDSYYGLWIDGKRVPNAKILEYHPDDLPYFSESKLMKNAKNYGKHYVQVNVMSNSYWQDQKDIGFVSSENQARIIDLAVKTKKELRIRITGKSVYVNGSKTSLRDFKQAVNAATRNWNEDDFENSTLDLRIKNVDRDFMQKLNDAFKKTDFYKANPGRYQYGINPPPPPPPPPAPKADNVIIEEVELELPQPDKTTDVIIEVIEEEESGKTTRRVKRKAVLDSDLDEDEEIVIEIEEVSPPPPPPPPKKPIEAIKDLIAQGASFYLDGNKISAEKALALVKADKINYIDVEKVDNNPPKVLMKQ